MYIDCGKGSSPKSWYTCMSWSSGSNAVFPNLKVKESFIAYDFLLRIDAGCTQTRTHTHSHFGPKYYTGTHHRLEPTTPRWGWRWTRGAWEGQLKSVWKLCMHTWGQMQQSATARWNWRSSAGIQSTQKLHQEPELSVLVISLTSNVVFLTKPGTRQCRQLVEPLWGTSRTSGSRPSPTFELNTQYYVP